MRFLRIAALALLPLNITWAQSTNDNNEGQTFGNGASPGTYVYSWWGKLGRTYFVQYSEDLVSPWSYMPIIEAGQDAQLSYGFANSAPRFFLRLRHTDQLTSDAHADDFDGDGVSNWDELQQGTDPFIPLGARLAITWPSEGSTIPARTADVYGTWGAITGLRSLTLNGVPVFIAGNTWVANAVPLIAGQNLLTLSATDQKGAVTTLTRNLFAAFDGSDPYPVVLQASTNEGAPPLNVVFTTSLNVPGTIESITYYFTSRSNGLAAGALLSPIAHQYNEYGTFYPTVTVKLTDGSSFSSGGQQTPLNQRLAIKVVGESSPMQVWESLKNAVASQDSEAIGSHFSNADSSNYKELFSLLGPQASLQMLTDFGTLTEYKTLDFVAQYIADITTQQGVISFPVCFEKENGEWKIESF